MNYSDAIDQYHKLLTLYLSFEVHDEFVYKKIMVLKGLIDSQNLITITDHITDMSESSDRIDDSINILAEYIEEIKNAMD